MTSLEATISQFRTDYLPEKPKEVTLDHGGTEELRRLLGKLGYAEEENGIYSRIKGDKIEFFGEYDMESMGQGYFNIEFGTVQKAKQFEKDFGNKLYFKNSASKRTGGFWIGAAIGLIIGVVTDLSFKDTLSPTPSLFYLIPTAHALIVGILGYKQGERYDNSDINRVKEIDNIYLPHMKNGKEAIVHALQ